MIAKLYFAVKNGNQKSVFNISTIYFLMICTLISKMSDLKTFKIKELFIPLESENITTHDHLSQPA